MIQVLEDLSGSLSIPDNFSLTVAPYDPSKPQPQTSPSCSTNPQTTEMCAVLDLADIYAKSGQNEDRLRRPENREELDRDDGDDDNNNDDGHSVGSAEEPSEYLSDISGLSNSLNPDEISIESEGEQNEEERDESAEGTPPAAKDEQLCGVTAGNNATQTPMVLPAPKYDALPSDPPVQSAPVEGEGPCEEDEDGSLLRNLKRVSNETAVPASSGTTSRIKRRNQGIYSAVEDDEAGD